MKKVQIFGKSNYALAVILDMLYLQIGSDFKVEVYANIPEAENSSRHAAYRIPGIEVIEPEHSDYAADQEALLFCGSIGKSRRQIVEFFHSKYKIDPLAYAKLIHPSAVIPSQCEIGPGVHIGPNATLAPFAKLGLHCVINRNTSIGHHSILSDYTTINPGVTIAGLCRIGENSIIGAGAVVLDQIEIGKNTLIGAGAVVTKSIPDNVIAYGSPARVVRENKSG